MDIEHLQENVACTLAPENYGQCNSGYNKKQAKSAVKLATWGRLLAERSRRKAGKPNYFMELTHAGISANELKSGWKRRSSKRGNGNSISDYHFSVLPCRNSISNYDKSILHGGDCISSCDKSILHGGDCISHCDKSILHGGDAISNCRNARCNYDKAVSHGGNARCNYDKAVSDCDAAISDGRDCVALYHQAREPY